MKNSKQIQKAGNDSQQIQANTIIFNNGITEERTREIFSEMFELERVNYTQEAIQTAQERVNKLERSLIPRIESIEGASASFSDPKFQFLLRSAQKAAASSENENDYDLLTELLVCHIQKGESRKTRAGISRAIEIVDEIDNDALCALTVVHAVNAYSPIIGDPVEGMKVIAGLFERLEYEKLPQGSEWIDHLDVLGAVRMSSFGHMKHIDQYYPEKFNGYVCTGIKVDSENYLKAVELLKSVRFQENVLNQNVFLEDYVRIPIVSKEMIDGMVVHNNIENRKITQKEVTVLNDIFKLYDTDNQQLAQVKTEFMKLWDSYDSLRRLREWWDSIPCSVQITQVGNVLAHTNAKRCDPQIPDLI